MIYKVSYVVLGGNHPGAIRTQKGEPKPGDRVRLGSKSFEVVEVMELMPSREDFAFVHATLREVAKTTG